MADVLERNTRQRFAMHDGRVLHVVGALLMVGFVIESLVYMLVHTIFGR